MSKALHLPPLLQEIFQRDDVAYPLHAATARIVTRLGGPPAIIAAQWVKAASHARATVEIEHAAQGIRLARERAGTDATLDANICAVLTRAAPRVRAAIELSNAPCKPDVTNFAHVQTGSEIQYRSWPPSGGPHYPETHPAYGVVIEPVLPGYWVHNLEHGAVVLAYHCPTGCPELISALRRLHDQLPVGSNARSGVPRMLVVPISYLDHRLAVIAWGSVLLLDELDETRIISFYQDHIDRGPECRNRQCPE
ncbi:MAG: DUF3105 domain-containing protein [Chloroflexota bacterium]